MEIVECFNGMYKVVDKFGIRIKTFTEYEDAVKFVKLFDYV